MTAAKSKSECWLGFLAEPLGSAVGHLEDASPLAFVENLTPDFFVIKVNHVWVEVSIIIISDLLKGRLLNALMAFEDVTNCSRNHTES